MVLKSLKRTLTGYVSQVNQDSSERACKMSKVHNPLGNKCTLTVHLRLENISVLKKFRIHDLCVQ